MCACVRILHPCAQDGPNLHGGAIAVARSAFANVTDSSFKQVVLHDTSTAVLVLFYRPSLKLCAVNGTMYAEFAHTTSAVQARSPTVPPHCISDEICMACD